ncbi:hypothetical protein Tco_0320003 [Tanacetum coccineum]
MESLNFNSQEKELHQLKQMQDKAKEFKEGKVISSKSLGYWFGVKEKPDINSVNDKQPMAEVQLSAEHNILANEQQHSKQSDPFIDTYLLESNNQTSRNWPASKSSEETLKVVQKADHSRNPSSFSDFKHFVCSTCQKRVFNANYDACITKFLKEVNSRAKIQPNKTRNSNKAVDLTSHNQKPGRKEDHFYDIGFLPYKSLSLKQILSLLRKKVEAMPKSAWTEKDQIDNFLKERRFYTLAGNPVKEILLKLNLPDHRILKDGGEVKEFQRSFRHSDTERLSRSDEVLKLNKFRKDATLKLFKSTNQERYEHVGLEVTSSQDGKVYKMAKRDYDLLMISSYYVLVSSTKSDLEGIGGLKSCFVPFSLSLRLTNPCKVDSCPLMVDSSITFLADDPTKHMVLVPLVDALSLSNPRPILQLGDF